MTEKRFSLRLTKKDNGVKIFDNIDEDNWRVLSLSYRDYEDTKYVRAKLEPVVGLLNQLNDENEQLKQQLKDCTAKAKEEIRKEKEEMAI